MAETQARTRRMCTAVCHMPHRQVLVNCRYGIQKAKCGLCRLAKNKTLVKCTNSTSGQAAEDKTCPRPPHLQSINPVVVAGDGEAGGAAPAPQRRGGGVAGGSRRHAAQVARTRQLRLLHAPHCRGAHTGGHIDAHMWTQGHTHTVKQGRVNLPCHCARRWGQVRVWMRMTLAAPATAPDSPDSTHPPYANQHIHTSNQQPSAGTPRNPPSALPPRSRSHPPGGRSGL